MEDEGAKVTSVIWALAALSLSTPPDMDIFIFEISFVIESYLCQNISLTRNQSCKNYSETF